jgi:hypothetical protein
MIMAYVKMPLRHSSGSFKGNCKKLSENFVRAEFQPANSQIQVSFVVVVLTFPLKPSNLSRAIVQAVTRWLPTAVARVRARSVLVGFVEVDKVTLGQVFIRVLYIKLYFPVKYNIPISSHFTVHN